MDLKEFLSKISALVDERKIILHGPDRCLFSEEEVKRLAQRDKIKEENVGVAIMGSRTLSLSLRNLELSDLTLESLDCLVALKGLYTSEHVNFYVDKGPDKLALLEDIIIAADRFILMCRVDFLVKNLR